ncbi:MAG: hypothetical protein ABJA49_04390, partial [Betaproteobacteria bacterium]
SLLAGIGNAYSDEILHVAKLSPFAASSKLDAESVATLYAAMRSVLSDAVERSAGQDAARLKGEKRSGMRVHARAGLNDAFPWRYSPASGASAMLLIFRAAGAVSNCQRRMGLVAIVLIVLLLTGHL